MTARRSVRSHAHWGAFTVDVDDGRIVGVRPFERDPYPSPMIEATPDIQTSTARVLRPMVRKGFLDNGPGSGAGRGREPFVPVTWDRALDLVAGELGRVRREHGNQAIFGGSYGWSSAGRLHHARTLIRRFLYGFGGCTDQVTNYSYGAAMVFLPHIVGSIESLTGLSTDWNSIARHTRTMVMFGGASLKNGQVASGGAGENSYEIWLRKATQAGVRFINVSPIRDDGPDFMRAEWLPIRPNTDTALMLALTQTLIAEGLADEAFLATHTAGFERVRAYLMGEADGEPKTPEWAAAITQVPADTIRALARRMAAERTFITATWSLQRADHGEQPYWALITLAAALGQIGLPGGGFGFGYGSINGVGNPRPRVPSPSMPPGSNPLNLAIPVARITDLLLNPGATLAFNGREMTYPDIRLIYWAGGNPFHHHQDINRLITAWRRPDTVIVNEPWWTATARFADIVLPATTALERNDIGSSPRDRFVMAMPKAIEPVGEARDDYAILSELAGRLGFRDTFTEGRDEMAWLRHLYGQMCDGAARVGYNLPDFDTFWADGYIELPEPAEDYVFLKAFRADPAAHPLRTPSGRIELYSETIAGFGYDDCPGHATWLQPAEWLGSETAGRFPLHLISNQPKTRLHSQMDAGRVSRAAKIEGREPMLINPADAAARGIADGDVVRVFNDRGACLAGARVTDAVRPGVVQLPSGAWYDPAEPDSDGSLDKHGNPNMLTADRGTSRLGQGPTAMTALVEVERFLKALPPITAFDPPRETAAS